MGKVDIAKVHNMYQLSLIMQECDLTFKEHWHNLRTTVDTHMLLDIQNSKIIGLVDIVQDGSTLHIDYLDVLLDNSELGITKSDWSIHITALISRIFYGGSFCGTKTIEGYTDANTYIYWMQIGAKLCGYNGKGNRLLFSLSEKKFNEYLKTLDKG